MKWELVPGYKNYSASKSGIIFNNKRKKILSPGLQTKGYLQVVLHENGIRKSMSVHRIIAKTFIPNPLNLPQVNHKNGVKTDNRVENLEWCTHKQNQYHAWDAGLMNNVPKKGELHWKNRLSSSDIIDIKRSFLSALSLSEKYNISRSYVYSIKNGYAWKHILQ